MSEEGKRKLDAARRLSESLAKLEKDEKLNAKERRSGKRKAEAIASEETGGGDVGGLLEWYKTMAPPPPPPPNTKDADGARKGKKIPYILFVGQLSFGTTSDMLFEHFRSTLGKDAKVTRESVKIRLLVDPKKKNKSRGMAFVELESPEVMYECLKLHLTHLDGRRINGAWVSGWHYGDARILFVRFVSYTSCIPPPPPLIFFARTIYIEKTISPSPPPPAQWRDRPAAARPRRRRG